MAEISLRERAIRLLARRDHSRVELARKLAPYGAPEDIDAVMERMIALGLLSDARYAESWVRSRANRFGIARIRHDLAQRGLDRDTIDAALEAEPLGDEMDRARAVWASRFGEVATDRKEWARQARFLQARGFSTAIISKLLRAHPDDAA